MKLIKWISLFCLIVSHCLTAQVREVKIAGKLSGMSQSRASNKNMQILSKVDHNFINSQIQARKRGSSINPLAQAEALEMSNTTLDANVTHETFDMTGAVIPDEFRLYANYPNPFNPITTIRYDLPEATDIKLTVYHINGQKVSTLIDAHQSAGQKSFIWDGRNDAGQRVSSGTYICKIYAGHFSHSIKMLLMK